MNLKSWMFVAFATSVGAAAIHHAAALEHLSEWRPAGMFMLVLGLVQLGWAIGLVSGGRAWLHAGVAINGGTVALWVMSRTTGLPVGPMPWEPEHIHGPDVLATVLEAGVVVACLAMLWGQAAPSGTIVRGWLAVSLGIFLVASHDPIREHLIALATLLIAAVAVPLIRTIEGSSHVETSRWSTADRPRAVVGAGSGAL